MWGCFALKLGVLGTDDVFPTHVGVFLHHDCTKAL